MALTRNLMIVLFGLLMGVHVAANAVNDVVLTEPGPIAVPTGKSYSIEEVRKAVISGALRHQWRVESETPGTVRIILDGRNDGAVLVMDIIYDSQNYSIKYVRSERLRYGMGSSTGRAYNPNMNTGARYATQSQTPMIHSSYSRWMKSLVDAINTELNVEKM